MSPMTIKTSTIFISKGGKTQVFKSVNEVPAPLRDELEKSTNGFNSATILIADKRGREEIVRALHGLPSGLRSRIVERMDNARPEPTPARAQQAAQFLRRNWMEILLPAAVGAAVWLALNYR